jgi:glycine/D-amino acid oxidase-like deaminating enzyme
LGRATLASGPVITADRVLVCTNGYSGDLVPGLDRSIVAANSLQIATAPLPADLDILPGGEVLSDTRRVIRYWRRDEAGRLLMGGRGPYRDPDGAADWAHLVRDIHTLFPQIGAVALTHRWGGRVAIHTDFLPKLHAPAPGCLVAIGCQGRGIGWQTAIGQELAAIAHDPAHEPLLPFSAIRPIPLHGAKAAWTSAAIAIYCVLDTLGWE